MQVKNIIQEINDIYLGIKDAQRIVNEQEDILASYYFPRLKHFVHTNAYYLFWLKPFFSSNADIESAYTKIENHHKVISLKKEHLVAYTLQELPTLSKAKVNNPYQIKCTVVAIQYAAATLQSSWLGLGELIYHKAIAQLNLFSQGLYEYPLKLDEKIKTKKLERKDNVPKTKHPADQQSSVKTPVTLSNNTNTIFNTFNKNPACNENEDIFKYALDSPKLTR